MLKVLFQVDFRLLVLIFDDDEDDGVHCTAGWMSLSALVVE